jgi:broad specificity phosphatase PhoE
VLTNHGVQQATRLGQHFAASAVQFTHIFSSQLQRAVRTAELVRNAQPVIKDEEGKVVAPIVAQINELAEQDFGSYEGVSFLARQPGSKMSGKDAHRAIHKDDPGFVDMEARESMVQRVDVFLDGHLMPVVQAVATTPLCIAIVSHGITLSVLWRRLLHRMPPRSVSVHPEVSAKYTGIDLGRIGGWSNTGYLELEITYTELPQSLVIAKAAPTDTKDELAEAKDEAQASTSDSARTTSPVSKIARTEADDASADVSAQVTKAATKKTFVGWNVAVHAVNSRAHLTYLKRTGGGVGSARHDDKQKSIDTFFKKRKKE